MFGGRDEKNNASNRLLCIRIEKSLVTAKGVSAGEPLLTFQKLEPKGIPPPARYMHTMTYFKDRSLITIAGGRNDKLSHIVLGDLWVLRLDDLEYCKVTISSTMKMSPRYNHTAVQFGSKLIIFGGMNKHLTMEMSAQEFELD